MSIDLLTSCSPSTEINTGMECCKYAETLLCSRFFFLWRWEGRMKGRTVWISIMFAFIFIFLYIIVFLLSPKKYKRTGKTVCAAFEQRWFQKLFLHSLLVLSSRTLSVTRAGLVHTFFFHLRFCFLNLFHNNISISEHLFHIFSFSSSLEIVHSLLFFCALECSVLLRQ